MGDAADHDHTQAADASAQPDNYSDLAQYKCSACGACSSVAAMPGFTLKVPGPTPVAQWEAVQFIAHFGFVTDGPERPPKHTLV
jgi:hypothetical protein